MGANLAGNYWQEEDSQEEIDRRFLVEVAFASKARSFLRWRHERFRSESSPSAGATPDEHTISILAATDAVTNETFQTEVR